MLFNLRPHAAITAVALAAASILASCSTPPAPTPPPVVKAPPAPPPITLSSKVVERASAFRGYMQRAGAIDANFQNGEQIQASLKVGVGYEQKHFLSGVMSYGAVLALQDPTFVASVRAFAADPAQRQQVINQLIADPAYAVGFKGSDTAAARIIDTLGADGLKVYQAGKKVKQSAYDVQRVAWSKAAVTDRDGRLAYAKSASTIPALADTADVAQLQQATMVTVNAPPAPAPAAASIDAAIDATAAAPAGPRSAPPPYRPTVIRSLAVAALAALGAAGDDNLATIDAIMAEPSSASCLNMAKLNLYQCLAVSKPHYEDIFCLGQHAMIDTGACVIKASGAPMPVEPLPPPPPEKPTAKKKTTAKPAAVKKKKA